MKINKEVLIPSINIILIITLIALASSCVTSKVTTSKYGMHVNKNYNICPAYN